MSGSGAFGKSNPIAFILFPFECVLALFVVHRNYMYKQMSNSWKTSIISCSFSLLCSPLYITSHLDYTEFVFSEIMKQAILWMLIILKSIPGTNQYYKQWAHAITHTSHYCCTFVCYILHLIVKICISFFLRPYLQYVCNCIICYLKKYSK